MPIDYSQSYNARWSVRKIDRDLWAPVEEVWNVASFSVDRDATDDVPLLETGSIEVDLQLGDIFDSGWYRIVMETDQGGLYTESIDIATLWFETVSGTVTADRDTVTADGKSVLYPASTTRMDRGTYVPKGIDGAGYCANLLSMCTPAPVEVFGSFTIDEYYVFRDNVSILEAVWTILDSGNFCIQIQGDGTIQIMPRPTQVSLELGKVNAAMLGASYDYKKDLSEICNVYIAIEDEQIAKSVNDDPYSITSTVNRGFEVTYIDTDPIRVNGETLQSYADRRLYEERMLVKTERSYTREYWPGVFPFSKVRWFEYDGFSQDMTVQSQSLTLENGLVVSETSVVYSEE